MSFDPPRYNNDDLMRAIRALHEVVHIALQQLATIESRIHALEAGQGIGFQLGGVPGSDQGREHMLTELKAAANRERARIWATVETRLDQIGDNNAAPPPPPCN